MEPVLTIEATIQAAIDRAAAAWEEVEGYDISEADLMPRWYAYAAELSDMGLNWQDHYPLADELSGLRTTTLMAVWNNLIM